MCMIGDAEPWDFCTYDERRAAKEHRCGECGRTIAKGERYENFRGLMDGYWQVYRTCQHCEAARTWLVKVCSGWMFDYVGEELREHWEENWEYRSLWLGRAIVGMRNRWTRRDGSLMDPLPAFAGLLPHEAGAAS